MKKELLFIYLISCFSLSSIKAQNNTVGLLSYDIDRTYEGYNLIYPHNQPNVFLLNNCGELVNVWTDSAQYRPGNTAYLLPNGNLVKTKRNSSVANDAIWAGGGGAIIEIRTWENDLVWSFEMNDTINRLHHDFAITKEGTILGLAWEKKTEAEAIQAGRDPSLLPDGELWPEWVFEIDPTTDQILWEWHLWDHLVQDFDNTKDNFGIVANHPELLDINYNTNNGGKDWLHSNALDFNDELDQILISTPYLNEVYIIDHSTSTTQAAGHNGGQGGVGGDFMFRWGNLLAYDQGTEADQTMFFNHDVRWIDDFVSPTHPHYGKLSFFNNQAGSNYSSFNVFNPPWDMYKWKYVRTADNKWGPFTYDVDLTHPVDTAVYSTGLSSVQALDNGNYLICSGRQGYAFEMSPEQEIVWEYIVPFRSGQPVSQGETLNTNDNLTFRMDRYPVDFPGFAGKDLSAKGWIELNPDSTFCDGILPVFNQVGGYHLSMFPNPADDMVTIEWEGGIWVDVDVIDLMGRTVIEPMRLTGGRKYLSTSHLTNGMYCVRINGREAGKLLITR